MKKIAILSIFLGFLVVSCQQDKPKIKSPKGVVEIITNIYLEASKGLDSVRSYQVSKLNYQGDTIIEFVPNLDYPQFIDKVFFIKDSLYFDMGTTEQAQRIILDTQKNNWLSVYKKQRGAVFYKGVVLKYAERQNITDTVLFNKKYKRFEVRATNNFSRYYIYETDTILPYSLNHQIDKDYNGRLERIDSYDKVRDIFITVQLVHRTKMEEDAQDILDFQKYIQNRK